MGWSPPGRNCGACGLADCDAFVAAVKTGNNQDTDCPFYDGSDNLKGYCPTFQECRYSDTDILGNPYDFILMPFPGEVSARKILLPFRPDLVEKWAIAPGDILTGRPMGAGCPVQHVLAVISASMVSGVITCHVVGPAYSRGKVVKDLEAYHMIGFEGIAVPVLGDPVFGKRMRFLPGFCMMNVTHTGVVNFVATTDEGIRVRVEDIVLL
ncbi:MAG TPA: (Fe-S)-binding protein [Methanospirillum sp.]|nr:(Fe-S)-binding protein [Methanospirillum sp.]